MQLPKAPTKMINIYQHDQHQHPKPQGDQPLIDVCHVFCEALIATSATSKATFV